MAEPSTDAFKDGQLAKAFYLKNMAAMKQILNMGEVKFGSRDSAPYKFFKKVVMDEMYDSMADVFECLDKHGVLEKCTCGATIRQGYKPCPDCNGCGYRNSPSFREYLTDAEGNQKGRTIAISI